jgi:hypothetical protein
MKICGVLCLMLLPTLVHAQSNPALQAVQLGVSATPSLLNQPVLSVARTAGIAQQGEFNARLASGTGLSFAPAVTYASGGSSTISRYYPQALAVADLNGDGQPDVVVANTNNPVGVLLANSDGTFQPVVTYSCGEGSISSVAAADVNGDGKPDVVAVVPNDVCVLLNNGDGTFASAVFYSTGGSSFAIALADVNGDGFTDIVTAREQTISVLLNNGNGTFQEAVTYSGGDMTVSVALGDLNGDGFPDIVVAGYTEVSVLLNNGNGTFQTAVTYGPGGLYAEGVAIADVNGDGIPDILVANECADNICQNGSVGVLLGNSNGTFKTAVAYLSGGQRGISVTVADVNGDGIPDLVVANASNLGELGVLLGNGNGTFQAAETFFSGGPLAISVAVTDINGDGKPDLLVANLCTGTMCGTPAGSVGVLINTSVSGSTTTLVSSPNPSRFGQALNLTATVTPKKGFYAGTPTGAVSFFNGTTNLGSSSLNSSAVAVLTTSALPVGTNSVTATYSGNTKFASSTSPVVKQLVQGAIVGLSTTTLNFGNQTVGITSSAKAVTLTNKGNIALTISSISVAGTDSGDFARGTTCSGSVAPNGTCTISVTFKPTATGTRTANITIKDNASGSPQSIALAGTGVLPAVTFSATNLTFPTQIVFTTSKAQTVKLSNSGPGLLKITDVGVSGPFGQTNNCGSTVAVGGSCTLTIIFKPTTIGSLSGSVSVMDNASASPQKISLKGTGTAFQLMPSGLNFGNQPVGTTSLSQTITLSNKSDGIVSITSISIAGANAGDFHQSNTCGTSVASGASCFIKVTFKPAATGARTAAVSISDNGGGSPQKVSLTGTGT